MSTIEKALDRINDTKKNAGENRKFSNGEGRIEKHGCIELGSSRTLQLPWESMRERGMLTLADGRSQIAEEMRAIKRPLLKNALVSDMGPKDHSNLIMVTSSMPGEGKSFNSINLAVSIAMELDRTALLVDADVAKPSIARYLGFHAEKGLIDYLTDTSISLSDIMIKTDLPKLSILPAGRQHHYSTELLASENMLNFLDELSRRYHDRVVIFDSPPLLATSESQVLANQVGQVVIVVEAVKTSQVMLKEAMAKIPNANVAGFILNKSRVKGGGSTYGYGYGYGYGKDESSQAS